MTFRSVNTPCEKQMIGRPGADIIGAKGVKRGQFRPRIADHILDQDTEEPAQRLMAAAIIVEIGIGRINGNKAAIQNRQLRQFIAREELGPKPIMQIVMIISDIIGNGGHLRLGAGMGRELQINLLAGRSQRPRDRRAHRAIMFGNPLKRFPTQVQAIEIGVVPLQMGHNADRLRIVIKATERRHQILQGILARMAERRMAQIMGQRHGLGQILIQPQGACDGARHLRHLDGMGQPRTEIIALMFHKNLGLVFEPAKGRGMDDPVAVTLKG